MELRIAVLRRITQATKVLPAGGVVLNVAKVILPAFCSDPCPVSTTAIPLFKVGILVMPSKASRVVVHVPLELESIPALNDPDAVVV